MSTKEDETNMAKQLMNYNKSDDFDISVEQIIREKPLEDQISLWRHVSEKLYQLLDDIDTASDMAKDNDEFYRRLVEKGHRKRFDFFDTDGYTLHPSKKLLTVADSLKSLIK